METSKLKWLFGLGSLFSLAALIIAVVSGISFASGQVPAIIKNILITIIPFGILFSFELYKWKSVPEVNFARWASWSIIFGPVLSILFAVTGVSFGGGNMIIDTGRLSAIVLPFIVGAGLSFIFNLIYWFTKTK